MKTYAFPLLLLVLATHTHGASTAGAPRPDIVVVVADEIGWQDLAAVAQAGWAPNLEALGRRGFHFMNLRSAPVCAPARRMLHFGEFFANRSGDTCAPANGQEPPSTAISVAELVRARGYDTALLGKWHVGSNPIGPWPGAVLARGFDAWRAGIPMNVRLCGGTTYSSWREVEDDTDLGIALTYQPFVMRTAFATLWNETPAPRFFVFASQYAHSPYHRPPGGMLPPGYPATSTERQHFEAMIAALDREVGRVVAEMDLDEDVLVFVADNGTPAALAPDPSRAKGTTFERGVRVPAFVVGAGIPAGSTFALASIVDLYATVADLAGTSPPQGLDSRSLVPLIDGRAAKVRDYVAVGTLDSLPIDDLAACSLRYKYRRWRTNDGTATGPWVEEFYDLLADPDELVNVVSDPALAGKVAAHAAFLDAELP